MNIDKFIYEASEWIWRIISTNILWIFFTIAGLGVFGFFPATIALFTITRKWVMKELDISIWKTFKEIYKKEFFRANGLGIVFIAIGIFLYIDLKITETMIGIGSVILYTFIMFTLLLWIFAVIYFFPIYVHYVLPCKQYIKQSFIIAIINPRATLFIGIGLYFIGYIIQMLPGLIPFVASVFPAYWIMHVCFKIFTKMESNSGKEHDIVFNGK